MLIFERIQSLTPIYVYSKNKIDQKIIFELSRMQRFLNGRHDEPVKNSPEIRNFRISLNPDLMLRSMLKVLQLYQVWMLYVENGLRDNQNVKIGYMVIMRIFVMLRCWVSMASICRYAHNLFMRYMTNFILTLENICLKSKTRSNINLLYLILTWFWFWFHNAVPDIRDMSLSTIIDWDKGKRQISIDLIKVFNLVWIFGSLASDILWYDTNIVKSRRYDYHITTQLIALNL